MKRLFELILLAPMAAFAVPVLVDSALKGAVLLAVMLTAMLGLRRSSSALRHSVLTSAMVLLLVLPILSLSLPSWRVLPAWASIETKQAAAVAVEIPSPAVVKFSGDVPSIVRTESTRRLEESVPTLARENEPASWIPLVAWLWSLGAILFGLRLALSRAALWRLAHKAQTAEGSELAAMASQLKEELGIKRKVALLLHPDRTMPMTWGIFRTRLLLPAAAVDWDEIRLRAVLLHELAHVRRGDSRTQFLVQLTCAIHWFNPLAWIAAHRIATERECACDDLVLNSGIRASDYAEQLLCITTGYESKPIASLSAVAMAKRSRLEGRVTSILNRHINRRSIPRGLAVAVACVLAVLAMPVAMMQAVGQEDVEDSEKELQGAGNEDGDPKPSAVKKADLRPGIDRSIWSLAAGASIDELIKAETSERYGPPRITITDRTNPAKLEWFDEPTNLATDAGKLRMQSAGRFHYEDITLESQEYKVVPDPKATGVDGVGAAADGEFKAGAGGRKPIFEREFQGGARKLRGFDYRDAKEPEKKDPETPGKKSNAMNRIFIEGPDGKELWVDLDPAKISDEFFYEDFFTEELRIAPQEDNRVNLRKKLPDGAFSLQERVHADSFFRDDIPLTLDPSFEKAAEPAKRAAPATARWDLEKYPDNRRMQFHRDALGKLRKEREEMLKKYKPDHPLMIRLEEQTGVLEATIIALGEEIDSGSNEPKSTPGKVQAKAGKPVMLPLKVTEAKAAKAAVDAVIGGSGRGRVLADERSNSLIYIGDEATLKLVRSMLVWLDQEK